MPDSWSDFVSEYGVELGNEGPTVCIIHRRFVPCRHGREGIDCILSEEPTDIAAVRKYQEGEQ